jgi:nucleoid DNA-binding protein
MIIRALIVKDLLISDKFGKELNQVLKDHPSLRKSRISKIMEYMHEQVQYEIKEEYATLVANFGDFKLD